MLEILQEANLKMQPLRGKKLYKTNFLLFRNKSSAYVYFVSV